MQIRHLFQFQSGHWKFVLLIGNSRPIAEGHLVHHQHYQTRAEAKQELFEYIEVFYNRERLHSTNNYLSPVDYEMQLKSA